MMMYDCSDINAILRHYNEPRHSQFKIKIAIMDENTGKETRVMFPTHVASIEDMLVEFHARQKNEIRAQIDILRKKLSNMESING